MKLEASRNKHEILTNSEHYKNVAPKAPTSIPQIPLEIIMYQSREYPEDRTTN